MSSAEASPSSPRGSNLVSSSVRSHVRLARADDFDRVAEFFASSESACFCQYHDFAGDARAFQWTMATCPEANRDALKTGLEAGRISALIAEDAGEPGGPIVGWLRFGSPATNKTMGQRVYTGLPCFSGARQGVLSIYCMLVAPGQRRQGVARALLEGLIEEAPKSGFVAIEALPRGAPDVRDEELWTGPLELYREMGFEIVHDFAPYPVVRLDLGLRLKASP